MFWRMPSLRLVASASLASSFRSQARTTPIASLLSIGGSSQLSGVDVHGRPSVVWACLESGVVSSMLFLVGTVLCMIAIPPHQCVGEDKQITRCKNLDHQAAWCYLVASIVFMGTGLLEVAFSLRRLRMRRAVITVIEPGTEAARPARRCRLGAVPWDLVTAVFFLVPSVCYLFTSLTDQDGVCLRWLVFLRMTPFDFSYFMAKWGAILFIPDALFMLIGRYTYWLETPAEEHLLFFRCWRAEDIFSIDWAAYGDFCFLAGAIMGCYTQLEEYSPTLDWCTQTLWALDAVLYMIAGYPATKELLTAHGDVSP